MFRLLHLHVELHWHASGTQFGTHWADIGQKCCKWPHVLLMNDTKLKVQGVALQCHVHSYPLLYNTGGEWWSIVQGVSYAVSGIPVLLSLLLLPNNLMTGEKDPLFNHFYSVHMVTWMLQMFRSHEVLDAANYLLSNKTHFLLLYCCFLVFYCLLL